MHAPRPAEHTNVEGPPLIFPSTGGYQAGASGFSDIVGGLFGYVQTAVAEGQQRSSSGNGPLPARLPPDGFSPAAMQQQVCHLDNDSIHAERLHRLIAMGNFSNIVGCREAYERYVLLTKELQLRQGCALKDARTV